MAITSYTELVGVLATYVKLDSVASIPVFIGNFEARANRNIRSPEMEVRATATPTSEYIVFPTDFLELRNIQINGTPTKLLEYASPQKIDAMRLTTGRPVYYTVVGGQFQIVPFATGSVVEVSYFKKIPELSSTNASNWLLLAHPDYYLAGCLCEAYLFSLDDRYDKQEMIVVNKEIALNKRGRQKTYGSGPLRVSAV